MKKKKNYYPKPILKKFAQEIALLVNQNQGRLNLLESLEEMPYEVRNEIVEGMASFYQEGMVEFFYLLKMEYETEFAEVCDKALEKYRMAGMDVTAPVFFTGTFYKAYASCTRHTGRMTLDVAWVTENSALHVECFYLTYNPDGIHSFILVDDMPVHIYEQERQLMADMVEVDFSEACCLIYQAYANNLRYMTAPALGRYLYQKYIDYFIEHDVIEYIGLIRRLSELFAPRQLVNSYFQGIRNRDYIFLEALTAYSDNIHGIIDNLDIFLSSGTLLLQAQAQEVQASGSEASVSAYAFTVRDEDIYSNRLKFHLAKDEQKIWYIDKLELLEQECLNRDGKTNPFTERVICRIYYITDVDEVFDILEKVDNIHSIEELACGVHMRIKENADDYNQGVIFFNDVIADIVINNGEELALISKHPDFIDELHQLFVDEYSSTIIPLGTYEADMLTAYKYICGQYKSFEDIWYDNSAAGTAFDDGMRFLSVSYVIKDRAEVSKLLNDIKDMAIDISPDKQVYYQFNNQSAGPGYFAEYLLAADWLSVSAFGEADLNIARDDFEKLACEYLEFEGMEPRRGSIFDVLNTGIKKDYPELEAALKEIYLNKWYYSGLRQLQGMSPSEASKTEEGSRLLWRMLKKLRQKEKNNSRRRISLNEYIHKLEQKKEEKQ